MQNTDKAENTNVNTVTPQPRTTLRKIGRTTFIVSSSFNEKGKGDIISKLARLIENDNKGA